MIESRQALALRAALCPNPLAITAWHELRKFTTIEELDHSVTRVLPSVYRNIKSDLTGHDLLKLRGSARHTWARNTQFLRQLEPLILELSNESINYRILKGGAINLLFNPADFRIMGDIDLLISKSDSARVRAALIRAGFTPKYAIACPHRTFSRINLEASFVNGKDLEIDLHVAEERSESRLFMQMLKSPPQIVSRNKLAIKVPQMELLIIHALVHGLLAVESEDVAQMILDVELLNRETERGRLMQEILRMNVSTSFNDYLGLRERVLGECGEKSNLPSAPPQRWNFTPMQAARVTSLSLINLTRAIRFRAPRLADWGKIWKSRDHKRVLYLLWLYSGLIRQVESVVTNKFSGFLPKNQPDRQVSPAAVWANDWRFRITNDSQGERLELWLESQALKNQSFLIFSNGRLVAATSPNTSGTYLLAIDNPATSNEISIRLPFSGCRRCARDLIDLKIGP